ncbi:RNA-binding KH domain-containing protein PEPPER-like [Chenopodium quinoa]|uniref:K Homology domain-containing protein n=1 Tax=Chenopodium quinoa TaxID=63459 RepID=A0A803LYT2_CHEQI|nr:RNA-binding KH domain-containing protein PEPPER-like [Chenopodium quinoa]
MAETADLQTEHTTPPPETTAEDTQPAPDSEAATTTTPKWPGWPGDNVFRLIIPAPQVGSVIGRKGEFVKKMCDETRARIRILEAPVGTADRVVLISGKEEPDAALSPAMDAAVRVFKRVSGLGEGDDKGSAADAAAFCSIRLLVASTQAINLIGKQGSTIKAIQESSGGVVRILPEGELPSYAASDERIIEIHGEALKVQKTFEAVLGHLRKFLHDHSVVAVFEQTYKGTISQDRTADALEDKSQSLAKTTSSQSLIADHSLSLKRESYYDREAELDMKFPRSAVSLYGSDPALSSLHSTGLTRAAAPIITQVTQTMQVPLSYAEDIIGIAGRNIAYIRRASGAALTVQESHGRGDEITVEIKGTATQVQTAQQLIQDSINGQKVAPASMYGKSDLGLGTAYSHLPESTYHPSSLSSLSSYTSQGLGGGYSSGLGGYSSYRF